MIAFKSYGWKTKFTIVTITGAVPGCHGDCDSNEKITVSNKDFYLFRFFYI